MGANAHIRSDRTQPAYRLPLGRRRCDDSRSRIRRPRRRPAALNVRGAEPPIPARLRGVIGHSVDFRSVARPLASGCGVEPIAAGATDADAVWRMFASQDRAQTSAVSPSGAEVTRVCRTTADPATAPERRVAPAQQSRGRVLPPRAADGAPGPTDDSWRLMVLFAVFVA